STIPWRQIYHRRLLFRDALQAVADESEHEAAGGADDGANQGKQGKTDELVDAAFEAREQERQDEECGVPKAGAKGLFVVRSKETDDNPHNAPECQVPPGALQNSIITQHAAEKPERCCYRVKGSGFHMLLVFYGLGPRVASNVSLRSRIISKV